MKKLIVALAILGLSGCAERQPDMEFEVFSTTNQISIYIDTNRSTK